MHIIIGIIIALFIISLIWELIKTYWPIILVVTAIILLFVFGGIGIAISSIVICFILLIISTKIAEYNAKFNEKDLKAYLERNCLQKGRISSAQYGRLASGYVNRKYPEGSSYISIVSNFVYYAERRYISGTGVDKWIAPALTHIQNQGMVDTYELCQIVKDDKVFKYTHISSLEELVVEAMNKRCKEVNEDNGKPMFERITLDKEAVKEELAKKNIAWSDLYINGYKSMKTIESNEMSIDALDDIPDGSL